MQNGAKCGQIILELCQNPSVLTESSHRRNTKDILARGYESDVKRKKNVRAIEAAIRQHKREKKMS